MSDTLEGSEFGIDRAYLRTQVLLPALATVVAMMVGFTIVTALLFVAEGILVSNGLTQSLTLAIIYLLPHFVVGLGMGTRHGLAVAPPVVIAFTPVVGLIIAFAAFGGPVSTPFQSPALTLGAVVVWGLVATGGLLLGAKLLAPWLAERK
jgi:hypothetical protein